jgi:hypothetical protein
MYVLGVIHVATGDPVKFYTEREKEITFNDAVNCQIIQS